MSEEENTTISISKVLNRKLKLLESYLEQKNQEDKLKSDVVEFLLDFYIKSDKSIEKIMMED